MPDDKAKPAAARGDHSSDCTLMLPLNALENRIFSVFCAGDVRILPAGESTLFAVDLPVRGTRQRLQALPFALEERIAAGLERSHVALGPSLARKTAHGDAIFLAAVVSRAAMEAALHDAPDSAALIPEAMAIPVPGPELAQDPMAEPAAGTAGPDGRAAGEPPVIWAVWREGARAVVRTSDGTGFALRIDMLPAIWAAAAASMPALSGGTAAKGGANIGGATGSGARPILLSYGEPLPPELPARDLSRSPPLPDREDLRFDLRQGVFAPRSADWGRVLRRVAVIAAAGVGLHLAIAYADLLALRDLADAERAQAQAASDTVLPGVSVGPDTGPLLARLVPPAPQPGGSDFLPLLSDVTTALAGGPGVALRTLAWSGQDGQLVLQVQADGLDALQRVEAALSAAGFRIDSGVATANDGGAEVEIRLRRAEG